MSPISSTLPGRIVVGQEDHRRRVLPRNRMPDITFEAVGDPPKSCRGVGLLELPGSLSDAEAIHRLVNPNDIVFSNATSNVMELWLMWPDYNSDRGISWPITGSYKDPTGAPTCITRKEVAIGVRDLLLHFFNRYYNRPPTLPSGRAVRFPIGDGIGHISRQDIEVVKAYHLGGAEWQIELQIPEWVVIKSEVS